jgi:hypothetical protein
VPGRHGIDAVSVQQLLEFIEAVGQRLQACRHQRDAVRCALALYRPIERIPGRETDKRELVACADAAGPGLPASVVLGGGGSNVSVRGWPVSCGTRIAVDRARALSN